ncbi:MAG: hypothetical protein WCP85_09385 [Mariniphaga sp.]
MENDKDIFTTIQLFDKNGNPITDKLIQICDSRLLCTCDSIDLLPLGAIIDNEKCDLYREGNKDKNFLINKQDLKNITYSKVYNGCCGPSGDLMNVLDLNNNPIAFEYGDCWMSHYIEIPKSKVIAKREKIEEAIILFALTEYDNKEKIVDRVIGFDYNIVKQRLDKKIDERLHSEINDSETEKELKEKMEYIRLQDISIELGEDNDIDDFWLFTKYDENRRSNYSE